MHRIRRMINKCRIQLCSPKALIQYYRKCGMSIGNHCEINKNVSIITEPYLISIGDNVRITSGVRLITHDGGVYVPRHMESIKSICPQIEMADRFGKITIGNNVHIGVNVIVMPGVTIGSNVVIGAGAVVTKDIPDDSVAVGVPARPIESIEEYVKKNINRYVYTKQMSYEEKKEFLIGANEENEGRTNWEI